MDRYTLEDSKLLFSNDKWLAGLLGVWENDCVMRSDSPAIMDLGARLRELRNFQQASRGLPPLAVHQVRSHIGAHGNDAARARANLAGLVAQQAPHLRGVKSDAHITGRVLGLPKRVRVPAIWIDDPQHLEKVRYNEPYIRVGRPISPRGSTSLHFSFEAISKAHLELGLRTKQGRRADPSEHVGYIEREEAAAALFDDLKAAPSSPDQFVGYQEREDALANIVEGASAIFTNIEGEKADRIELFAAIAEGATMDRQPSLSLDLSRQSILLDKVRKEIESGRLRRFHHLVDNGRLELLGCDAEDAVSVLLDIGWRDRRKKAVRASRKEDEFGILHDPGKSARVQFRLVGELPYEVDHDARCRIVEGFCAEFKKRNLPYIAVIHAPGPNNHERNWHFHLVYHDRPVCRFDGTAETHIKAEDANKTKVSARALASKATWLNDPSIQSQIGQWDFRVRAEWRTKSRNRRVSYPFAQRKDREVTRKSFIPRLRALLSDLTNAELERVGVARRVDPLSHEKARREAVPGQKLFSSDHALELSGIPTPRGMANAQLQSSRLIDRLEIEEGQIRERTYCTEEERACAFKTIGNGKATNEVLRELGEARRERALLAAIARQADNVTGEFLSRPRMMAERNQQLMLDAYGKPKSQHKVADYARQLQHIEEHVTAMQILGKDLFQVSMDAEKQMLLVEKRIAALELTAGIREEKVFDFVETVSAERQTSQEVREQPSASLDRKPTVTNETPIPQDVSTKAIASTSNGDIPSREVSATPPPKAETEPSSKQTPRRPISSYIDKIYRLHIPFELRWEPRKGVEGWIAIIPAAEAQRHQIPETFELESKLDESRLIELGRARANFVRQADAAPSSGPSRLDAPRSQVEGPNDPMKDSSLNPQTPQPAASAMGSSSTPATEADILVRNRSADAQAPATSIQVANAKDQPQQEATAKKRHTFADRHFPRPEESESPAQPRIGDESVSGRSRETPPASDYTPDVPSTPSGHAQQSGATQPAVRIAAADPIPSASASPRVAQTATADLEKGTLSLPTGKDIERERKEELARKAREMHERFEAKKNTQQPTSVSTSQSGDEVTAAMLSLANWRRAVEQVSRAEEGDRRTAEADRNRLAFVLRRDLDPEPSIRGALSYGELASVESQADLWQRHLRQQQNSIEKSR